ncbi:Serine/threonine-protein phosphatase 2A activator 1 [Malassezia nana]|uniref:Serine/threonine-protein phosphatase 2A activator n=1 Tax=Malassezia nana TaxID=180528 RepID=A0AAF0EPG8_9BASI|nr:Serine/threonine-protein phosphatase 2A activator 1 [Malassezia nana]
MNEEDMAVWQTSDVHDTLLLFVMRLASACVGQPTRLVPWNRAAVDTSDGIGRILALLIELDTWTEDIAPLAGPQRFGNLAFRTWGARLAQKVEALHAELLPPAYHAFLCELAPYLLDAFGSFVRIDYGTGHELHFMAWLSFLCQLGVLPATGETETRLALEVIPAYLRVVWHLQDRYALEPAGSHGVWGLDDYHFVPYILGAAQLQDSPLSPAEIADVALYPFSKHREPRVGPKLSLVDTLAYQPPREVHPQPNLYVSSLARIHSLKRGPFEEHSPILYDISRNVAGWPKLYKGMLKMYDAECLMKRPVVQHFVFGAGDAVYLCRTGPGQRF